jgi:hypothetical protein
MNKSLMTRDEIELAMKVLQFCDEKNVRVFFQEEEGIEFFYIYQPDGEVVTPFIEDLIRKMEHHIKAIFQNEQTRMVNRATKILSRKDPK